MKTNFERGQLNAQDDLNANFKEIETALALQTTIVEGRPLTGAGTSETVLPFKEGSEKSTCPSITPFFTVGGDGNLLCLKAGTYLFESANFVQPSVEFNGYFYLNLKINGSRPANPRIGGLGANTVKNRNDFFGRVIATVPENATISVVTETNASVSFTGFGVVVLTITPVF